MSHTPRFMFAGTNSGCGKTTVTLAVMRALVDAGTTVAPFKCGPDYIDPMFHKYITNHTCTNLDSFFLGKNDLRWLMDQSLSESTSGTDDSRPMGIVEGVMGLFDGIGMTSGGSSFEIAAMTQTPIILVVNARGMALSIVPLLKGFVDYASILGQKHLIRGVLLNHVGQSMYMYLKDAIYEQTGLQVVGYFEHMENVSLESRHLGLVTAGEIADLDERMALLSNAAAASVDLSLLHSIADSAPPLTWEIPEFVKIARGYRERRVPAWGGIRLAVAMDQAFCFYYEANLDFLKSLGVTPVPFSPTNYARLPEDIHGLYLGGGYPELYGDMLSANVSMREDICRACKAGMPVIAECGGFMYLHEFMDGLPMVGVVPGSCRMEKKLGPFGYVHAISEKDDVFGAAGTTFAAHEFHYSASENTGSDYLLKKMNGKSWREVHSTKTMYAGYPHLYFYSSPQAVVHFVETMRAFKEKESFE